MIPRDRGVIVQVGFDAQARRRSIQLSLMKRRGWLATLAIGGLVAALIRR